MSYQAVLFDLDGTLLNSLSDIAVSANIALEQLGFPTHPDEAYKTFIGDGIATLFRRALPAEHRDEATVTQAAEAFRVHYDDNWHVRSHPYDGIPALLDALVERGTQLAILSNKPHDFTLRCVEHFLGRWSFRAILGARDDLPRKPDPAGANRIVGDLEIPVEQWLYVGDTRVDMETARAAQIVPIGVSWGFRPVDELRSSGAAAIIDAPGELLAILDGQRPLPDAGVASRDH